MKAILTLAAAAVALSASPALAKPEGGHGNGNSDKEWKHGGGDREDGYHDERRGNERNHGYIYRRGYHTSGVRCPYGLARKHIGCMPPGQVRRWAQGSRLPYGYHSYTPYNQIPQRYIVQYGLNPNYRYVYRGNTIYQVDPRTLIIQRIISALIR